jgi:hypothetical protein
VSGGVAGHDDDEEECDGCDADAPAASSTSSTDSATPQSILTAISQLCQ